MIRKYISSYVKIINITYETLVGWVANELAGCENDYLIIKIKSKNNSHVDITFTARDASFAQHSLGMLKIERLESQHYLIEVFGSNKTEGPKLNRIIKIVLRSPIPGGGEP